MISADGIRVLIKNIDVNESYEHNDISITISRLCAHFKVQTISPNFLNVSDF